MEIETIQQFESILDSGPHAFPGGYPVYFVLADNEPLSFEAALEHAEYIRSSVADKADDQWRVVAVEINFEDELRCSHTGEQIERAYPDDGEDDEDREEEQ